MNQIHPHSLHRHLQPGAMRSALEKQIHHNFIMVLASAGAALTILIVAATFIGILL
jgi:hypothetical protein